MIISHKYKFIFLKTNKTAGTSVEIALSKFCGEKDVITPISPDDEAIRQGLGYLGPRNYLSPVWDYKLEDMVNFLRSGKKKFNFYNHITASEVMSRVGLNIWNSYFKFCIERNPWDRVVSLYFYLNHTDPKVPFSEFIQSKNPLILKKKGFLLYTINGNISVDRICRFENLYEDLESVRILLGIPDMLDLPRAKSQYREEKRDYHDMFGETEKAKVEEIFAEEIKLFNYEFNQNNSL